jgi:chromosome segregation ATPase
VRRNVGTDGKDDIKGHLDVVFERLRGAIRVVAEATEKSSKGLGRIEARLDGVETRLKNVEVRVDGLGIRQGGIETRLDGIEAHQSQLEHRLKEFREEMRRELAELKKSLDG